MAVEFNKFFQEAAEAYDFYQLSDKSWVTTKKEYAKKFPLMTEYLKDSDQWQGLHLANMDFGQQDNEIIVMGNVVGWMDPDVNHMNSWGPLCLFLKKKYNAVKVVWSYEEDGCYSLEQLDVYEWEEIVKAILKRKEALPLLLNAHEDLDILITQTLGG